jgi:hypothetical protein
MTYHKVWHHCKAFSTAFGLFWPLFYSQSAHSSQCLIPETVENNVTDSIKPQEEDFTTMAPESLKPIDIQIPEVYSTTKQFIEAEAPGTIPLSSVESQSFAWLEQGRSIALSSGQAAIELAMIGDWMYNIKQAFQSDSATTYDKVDAVGSLFDVLGLLKVTQELGDEALVVKKWRNFSSTKPYHYNLKANTQAQEQQALKEAYFADFKRLNKDAERWSQSIAYNSFLDAQIEILNYLILQQQMVYKIHTALDQSLLKSLSYRLAHHRSGQYPLFSDLKRYCYDQREQLKQSDLEGDYAQLASCQKRFITHYTKALLDFFKLESPTSIYSLRNLLTQRLSQRAAIIQLAQDNITKYQHRFLQEAEQQGVQVVTQAVASTITPNFEHLTHQAKTHNMHEISLLTNHRMATESELIEKKFEYKMVCSAWFHARGGFTPVSLCKERRMSYKSYHAERDPIIAQMIPPQAAALTASYKQEYSTIKKNGGSLSYANQWLKKEVMALIDQFDTTSRELNHLKSEVNALSFLLQKNYDQIRKQIKTYYTWLSLARTIGFMHQLQASPKQIATAITQIGLFMKQPESQALWHINTQTQEKSKHITHHIEALLSLLEIKDSLMSNDTLEDNSEQLSAWLRHEALSVKSRDPEYWLSITQQKIIETYHQRHEPNSPSLARQLGLFYVYIKGLYVQIKISQITQKQWQHDAALLFALPNKLLKQTREKYLEQQNLNMWKMVNQIKTLSQTNQPSAIITKHNQMMIKHHTYSKHFFNKLSMKTKLYWLGAIYKYQSNVSDTCRHHDKILAETLMNFGRTLHRKTLPFIPLFYFELSAEIQRNFELLQRNKNCKITDKTNHDDDKYQAYVWSYLAQTA